MASFKAFAFILAPFFLLAPKVLSNNEDTYEQVALAGGPATAPAHPPVHSPGVPYMPPVRKSECPRLCEGRCKLHSRPRHCKRVCGTCCERCRCVPPGTAGNREMCGKCYTDMTTHGNRPKCP